MKSNPLATRFVLPGKIRWHARDDQSLESLRQRFAEQLNYRAAIVGPHGSGKSTLLAHLVPLLGQIDLLSSTYEPPLDGASSPATGKNTRRVVWLKLRGTTASLRLIFKTCGRWLGGQSVLVLDGYEQLGPMARGLVLLLTRCSGTGLLVTSHRTTWLPTLVKTEVDASLAQRLLAELLPEDQADRHRYLDRVRLESMLEKHGGNLREVFMDLYDELEQPSLVAR